ncbi:MAG TPA: pyridoxal phosphate-dependent aminotransferase [Rhizomicrobium sp.]|nr:pyridoxal phosphate-dependent aminotransferase [Rhizomicrobium sp.]
MTSPFRPILSQFYPNRIVEVASLGGLDRPGLIPLWFGESDLVTPKFIRDAAAKALDDGKTFYTWARGIPELREAISAYHQRTLDVPIDPERVTVPGAAMLAIVLALSCLVETGDNIVIIAPVWPNIFHAAQVAGAEVRLVRLDEDWTAGRWHLDLDKLFDRCDGRTKAIFVSTPNNPTGWMASRAEQQAMLDFARKKGIAIISDEVYGTLIYDGSTHAPSFLQIADESDPVFVVNSFSKPWAMTGWRIGWLTHPKSLAQAMRILSPAANTGTATFNQYGAMAALSPRGDMFRESLRKRCEDNRALVADFIARQNRVRWMKPDGAFYGFLHVDGLRDSLAFARELVLEANVGTAPGSAFGLGDPRDEAYVRICFARDADGLAEGLTRIGTKLGTV